MLALLEILQAGGSHTLGELARRLEVDARTVRRYIAHLTDLDVPIRSVRGRYGGYVLARGFRMPPLMLTEDEAVAVLLGLLGQAPTSPVAAQSATAKLRRVLPEALAAQLGALLETVEFTSAPRRAPAPEARVLLRLAEAARDRHPVDLGYVDRHGSESTRTLHPYGIVAHAGRWYVTGADSASGEQRLFRLDRIVSATLQSTTFEPPGGTGPAAQVVTALAATPYRHEVAVHVDGTADSVRTQLPPTVATVEPLPDGTCRVTIRAERLDWVPALLARLVEPFTVEHPDELRDLVRALAARLAAA